MTGFKNIMLALATFMASCGVDAVASTGRQTQNLEPDSIGAMRELPTQATVEDGAESALPDSARCIVNVINSSGSISVTEPAELTARLRPRPRPVATAPESGAEGVAPAGNTPAANAANGTIVATRNGYRVQIFDDNTPGSARARAEAHAAQAENLFPQWRAYITFNSPYWQVRVGDFKRRGEAEAAMAMIRDAMPGVSAFARIVAERINIIE